MSDASLEGMPEFDKPENIPVVIVPDQTIPSKPKCQATTAKGLPCTVPPIKGDKYCLGHAKSLSPELRDKWRRKERIVKVGRSNIKVSSKYISREELLGILTERLYMIRERYGAICNPEVEEMICNVARTIAAVTKIEIAEDGKLKGWRMEAAV